MRDLRRWLPSASMMLVSVISYVDRNTIALLSPTILQATHLDNRQYTWIVSAFSVAYTLANLFWGWLLDRAGLWIGMLLAVTLWSAASAAHALAGGLASFMLVRVLLGAGEGATFPGGLRAAAVTLPPEQRSRGIALAYSGGSLGAIVAPLIVTPIALHFGWRAAFLFTGLLGAVWLAGWGLLGVDSRLRGVTRLDYRRANPADLRLWAFIGSYALGAFPLGFVLYISPLYLNEALHISQKQLGHWLWIPPLGWEVGYFFWGWLSDRGGASLNHRRLLAMLVLLTTPLALTPRLGSFALVMAALFAVMFIASGFVMISIHYAIEAFSRHNAALIAGLGAGSWSAVQALLMPLIGHLSASHAYASSFVVAAICPAVGFLAWSVLDNLARRSAQSYRSV
jgi:ACS family hexuronate transporter-like MFS transporter